MASVPITPIEHHGTKKESHSRCTIPQTSMKTKGPGLIKTSTTELEAADGHFIMEKTYRHFDSCGRGCSEDLQTSGNFASALAHQPQELLLNQDETLLH